MAKSRCACKKYSNLSQKKVIVILHVSKYSNLPFGHVFKQNESDTLAMKKG